MHPARAAFVLLFAVSALQAQAARPRHNNSYVPDDDATTAGLVADARKAAESGDAEQTAERLQAILAARPGGVVSIRGRLLYIAPRRWAQIQLLSGRAPFGPEVLAAWRRLHDREATAAIGGAIVSGDENAILDLLDLYPAATAAPAALLALFDRAVQRGNLDAARGYLLRLPEQGTPKEAAAWLASPAYRRRREHLARIHPHPAEGWPTLDGNAARTRAGDPLPPPDRLRLLWATPLLEQPPDLTQDLELGRSEVLPLYPVCDKRYVYVHLGSAVAAVERSSGRLSFFAPEGATPDAYRLSELMARSPGVRAATVRAGVLYFNRVGFDEELAPQRTDSLVAFDVARRRTLWRVDPGRDSPVEALRRGFFFRGAPALYGGRLYVYGAVREETDDGPTRKEEAHLLCFDAQKGGLLWDRFLGYGETAAAPDFPPLSGLAPAVSAGVVVAVSGLGVAAALDARTGEIVWLLRYDRRPAREGVRLAGGRPRTKVELRPGWMREPPRILDDAVYFAPCDAEEMYKCWLRGARRPGIGFTIEQWSKHRSQGHPHSLLEYVAGFYAGRIYYVGRRDPHREPASYSAVVSHPLDSEYGLTLGLMPADGRAADGARSVPPPLFGRPVLAGSMLLVPTRREVLRFDLAAPVEGRQIAIARPYVGPAPKKDEEQSPVFGTLVSVEGYLYAVTLDRVLCYGAR